MVKVIACCGSFCDECPAFLATQANDVTRLAELAAAWSGEELRFQPDEILCDGCVPRGERAFSWCNDCTIRQCCTESGLANCAHCGDLPCDTLSSAPPGTVERLLRMRDGPPPRA